MLKSGNTHARRQREKNIARGVRTSLENFARKDDFDIYLLYVISNLYL
ncbi:MAG: hypothetical protein FWC45_05505 [Treponema sp.]|nr:hypothetical protein [Treponema sp.]